MSVLRDILCPVTRPVLRGVTENPCESADGPLNGDGLLLEDGNGYLLLESGDFLLLE